VVGGTTNDAIPFPLTQDELAQAAGMTPVHVNRMIQQLRADGLIDLKGKVLTVLDPQRLMEVAQFEPAYLHLVRTQEGDKDVVQRAGDLVRPDAEGVVQSVVDQVKSTLRKS
jgi:DNA-binding transcriptional regulator LsrR (DeoR family)